MRSNYAAYILEKTNKSIIETDAGFITYGFPDPKTCYIEDLFVKPEFRKQHSATDLANEVTVIAKERGCQRLVGSVVPSTKNSTDSIRVLLAFGMNVLSSANDIIFFSKDI